MVRRYELNDTQWDRIKGSASRQGRHSWPERQDKEMLAPDRAIDRLKKFVRCPSAVGIAAEHVAEQRTQAPCRCLSRFRRRVTTENNS
jgi:hypothetical protein